MKGKLFGFSNYGSCNFKNRSGCNQNVTIESLKNLFEIQCNTELMENRFRGN